MEEKDFKTKLTPEQYKIMREKGTEAPFTGKYLHEGKDGTYICAACGNPLFKSDAKFDSGTGWPSFDKAIEGSVQYKKDGGQTEIVCSKCGSHLGHVFDDGPTETGKRYCINSVCLDLKDKK
jgi:peptide-methionine (R)-S-oxide reductase